MTDARRRLAPLQLLAVMALAAALGGGVLGYLGGAHEEGEASGLSALLLGVAGLALATAALWLCVVYWRRLDEAAREAHKFAWYWGGSAGLLFAGIGLGMLTADPSLALTLRPADTSPADWIVFGGMTTVGLQIAGYALTWIGWWLWKGR